VACTSSGMFRTSTLVMLTVCKHRRSSTSTARMAGSPSRVSSGLSEHVAQGAV
jgi:hypothetical protein